VRKSRRTSPVVGIAPPRRAGATGGGREDAEAGSMQGGRGLLLKPVRLSRRQGGAGPNQAMARKVERESLRGNEFFLSVVFSKV
jgi:hypothetical protein